MIIGKYLMKKHGKFFDFKIEKWIWDDVIVPMWRDGDNRPKPTLNRSKMKQSMQRMDDTIVTR